MNQPPRQRKKPDDGAIAVIALNRRATFDYDLGDKVEAGIALGGSEVKMLRSGKADLSDAWVEIKPDGAWLRGLSIPAMDHSPFSHEPKRTRRLLMHEREIEVMKRGIDRDGMTVIATRLYFKGRLAKVEIALARGKKKGDKRESMKEKDADREARQAIARGRRG
ncbi:MAG: SsrA-binding protein SmpB [Polyangiaceae bacterium]